MNSNVVDYISKTEEWQTELTLLRQIMLDCALTEEFKWRSPCYTFNNGNVILLGRFKDACVVSFVKGVLLQDPLKILTKPGENSQSVRTVKFTSTAAIEKLRAELKTYIFEAIEVEKVGLKVALNESKSLDFPVELLEKFSIDNDFKKAFESLTPGRQRGYNLFFTAAKKSSTRAARIDKNVDRIFTGKGINDCVCGLSKRMPNCDGSHKKLD
mgnify:CR=1 FL=1